MSEMQIVNPETASHNIATVVCERCIKPLSISNVDDPDFHASVRTAAQIYTNAYDIAFNCISSENEAIASSQE